jgi:hypothetical protein
MSRKLLVFSGVFLLLALPGLIFAIRSPVLIVADVPFAGIYGAARIKQRQAEAAAALFRRVKPVIIAESAGPDLIAFAVEEADSRPYGVIFPYRYADGGRRYAAQFPGVRVIILDSGAGVPGAPGGNQADGGAAVLRTSRRTDFFRAGLMAGLVSRAGDPEGEILVFPGRSLPPADRNALAAGMGEAGSEKSPRFLNVPAEYAGVPDASCVILTGPATEFLDRNLAIPAILFSWLDPALMPREHIVVFDDSPFALAARAVKLAKAGGGDIPSRVVFPGRRIADKRLARDLKRAARASPPEG